MLISVIVPTYHRNDLLSQCLDHLSPQVQTLSADQYEVVVTDDGSQTTAKALICERYPWARWIEGPHQGPAANRNFGARNACAPWIAFTDDDCVPGPHWLQAFASSIRPEGEVYEGKTTSDVPYDALVGEAPVNLTGGNLWSCNLLIAARLFESVGGFDESFPFAYNEDADFRERLRSQGHALFFVSDAIVDHPVRPRKMGVAYGEQVESSVLLWYKAGHRGIVWPRLIKHVIAVRLLPILRQRPFRKSSGVALQAFFVELFYVAWHSPAWIHKYYLKYRDLPPAYPLRQF